MATGNQSSQFTDLGPLMDIVADVLAFDGSRRVRAQRMLQQLQSHMRRPTMSCLSSYRFSDSGDQLWLDDSVYSGQDGQTELAGQMFRSPEFMQAILPIAEKALPLLQQTPRRPLTFVNSELVGDELWQDLDVHRNFYAKLGYSDSLVSIWMTGPNTFVATGISKRADDPPYRGRERFLMSNAVRALAALIGEGSVTNGTSSTGELSHAQNSVLQLALRGYSEKQIAHQLHRSAHTIHSHMKQIYRTYRVSSRSELLARFIDQPAGGI